MKSEQTTLYKVKKLHRYRVVSVPEIAQLNGIGIRVGLNIYIQNHFFLGGPVLLRVDDAYTVALGKGIANQIFVEELHDDISEAKK